MCIGIPMQVVEPGEFWSLCEGVGGRVSIDMRLVGFLPAGAWVLVFRDAAREEISADRAGLISQALQGLSRAAEGEGEVDVWFADLVGREPQLPDFLKEPS